MYIGGFITWSVLHGLIHESVASSKWHLGMGLVLDIYSTGYLNLEELIENLMLCFLHTVD